MRNTINLYCLKEHITPQELADRLGISKDEVLTILKQQTVVPQTLLPKLCDIFNCEPRDLVM